MIKVFEANRWTSEWWAQLFITIVWGSVLLGYLRGIVNHLPIFHNFTDEIEIAMVVVPLCFSLPYFVKRLFFFDYVFVISCVLLYLLSYLNIFNIEQLDNRAYSTLCLVFPYYIVGRVTDFRILEKPFLITSVIVLFISVFYYFSYSQQKVGVDTSEYNMAASYNILQHVLLILWYALKKPQIWNVSLGVIGIFLILAFGTRGPLVCCIVFALLYLLLFREFKYKTVWLSVLTGVSLVVFSFLREIMLSFQILLIQMNMSTRIVDMLLQENYSSSGRDVIAGKFMDVLQADTGFWGHGIYGFWHYVGTYPHNIFLDFPLTFGWFLGIILLIAVFAIPMMAMRTEDSLVKGFVLLLFCASIVKLFMSGTFIDEPLLFLLIGYSITVIMERTEIYHR